ncbi:hypothetical protein F5B22DRAFT_658578 [Xylaria bambusicola]|uniref:uncharacterized protein n=1 Tax=Xylaria bambusicola TaxID=326684 RepID=UPI0020078902|nr:uncharacterized protein F5B22DRAFT_658578 [Xylaria bambusicola]KAI0509156.1 hypothetical protein F5B22DRAFT_658578 [Xylaria bambusicola]
MNTWLGMALLVGNWNGDTIGLGSSTWLCDNPDVGRGANKALCFFISTAAAAATGSVSSSYGGPYLSPQVHRPTTPPFQIPSTPKTGPGNSESFIPPAAEPASLETAETDAIEFKEVGSKTTVTEADNIESKVDVNRDSESVQEDHPSTTIETTQSLAIEGQERLGQSLENPDVEAEDVNVSLSNRIHIVGFNTHAKFLAHALASTREVPVQIFSRNRRNLSQWGAENRALNLYDLRGRWISSTKIPCPQPIIDPRRRYPDGAKKPGFLDNIIIDAAPGAVFPSIELLRPRIDRLTTICLLHPGLGLIEDIIDAFFPDPLDQPTFILGHSTHNVGRYSDTLYSLKQNKPGTLYLYNVPKFRDSTLASSHIAREGLQLSHHMIKLLSLTQTLNVVGLPETRFLFQKLPSVIFHSVADSICVILGCKYNQIRPNRDAMVMWKDLLNETLYIVSQLPELHVIPHSVERLTSLTFRRKLEASLFAQHANASPWVKQVRIGAEVPVDYFNGYFVRRAKELGLNHKHNAMALALVKARLSARRLELAKDLLGTFQYMGDTDTIGGAEFSPNDIAEELGFD